jgi:hypothetical protein
MAAPARIQARVALGADLASFVTDYEASLPGARSHAYIDPTDAEARLIAAIVRDGLRGASPEAVTALCGLGYELLVFCEAATGSEHLVLFERSPLTRCWGLYVVNCTVSARNVVVEAPHPLHDRHTPRLGIAAYLRLEARAFLMAGAHRYANGFRSLISDMARNPRSVFQRVHEAVTDPATHVVQVHGFSENDYPGYPGILLSNGCAEPDPELFELCAALQAAGEPAGVFDGVRWQQLGGLPNPQASHTRAIGGRFYHMEHELALRRDRTRRAIVVEALAAFLDSVSTLPDSYASCSHSRP